MRITSPEPNETAAATSPSSSRAPSWPLMRAWSAVNTPTSTAPPSAIQAGMRARVTPPSCRAGDHVAGPRLPWSVPISARTRSLLTWLPATILLVVIGLVVLATFAVQGSWWAEEKPAASADQKASDGSSILTDAGFDYVNVEGIVRVRIGEGALPAEELGMGANAEKSAEFRGPVRAVVAGGEDVYVVDDVGGLTAVTPERRTRIGDAHVRQPRHVVGCRRAGAVAGADVRLGRGPDHAASTSSSRSSTRAAPAIPSPRSSVRRRAAAQVDRDPDVRPAAAARPRWHARPSSPA